MDTHIRQMQINVGPAQDVIGHVLARSHCVVQGSDTIL